MLIRWQPQDGIYGLYDHHHVLVHLPGFDAPVLTRRQINEFVRSNTIERQEDRAFRDAVTVHEIRHMHDCCGTIAGITMFQTHISRLIEFAKVCARLRNDNLLIQLPLIEWVRDGSCPAYVREFWVRLVWSVQTGQVFTGRVTCPLGEKPTFEVYTDIEAFPGHRIPAIAIPVKQSEEGEGVVPREEAFFLVPIGFEHLIEGTAWALQDAYLDLWPSDVAESVRRRIKTESLRPSQPQTKGFYAYPPYEVTERLLGRYLSQRGVLSHPRDRLVELADRGLMWGLMPTHGATSWRQPGGGFVAAMEEADWTANSDRPATRPVLKDAELRKFRDELEARTPLPASLPPRTILHCLNYINRFVIRHISIPILDLRLKFGDRLMTHYGTYLRHRAKFPRPPMIVTDTQYLADPSAGAMFERNWIEFVMFSDVAIKIWNGRTRSIDCARAFNQIPGIRAFDFFPPTGCDREIKAKTCRIWFEGRKLPDCRFNSTLKGASLVPFEPDTPLRPVTTPTGPSQ
jgi:hypothetical protein